VILQKFKLNIFLCKTTRDVMIMLCKNNYATAFRDKKMMIHILLEKIDFFQKLILLLYVPIHTIFI